MFAASWSRRLCGLCVALAAAQPPARRRVLEDVDAVSSLNARYRDAGIVFHTFESFNKRTRVPRGKSLPTTYMTKDS